LQHCCRSRDRLITLDVNTKVKHALRLHRISVIFALALEVSISITQMLNKKISK